MAKGRMFTDIRVRRGAPNHIKVRKLRARFGWAGWGCLTNLWLYAADNAPDDGNLGPLSDEDLGITSGYGEEFPERAAEYGASLIELGLVERDAHGSVWIHDWTEEQANVARSATRSEAYIESQREKGRKSAEARREKLGTAQPTRTQPEPTEPSPNPALPNPPNRTEPTRPDRTGPDQTGPDRTSPSSHGRERLGKTPNELQAEEVCRKLRELSSQYPGRIVGAKGTTRDLETISSAFDRDPELADLVPEALSQLALEGPAAGIKARIGLTFLLRHADRLASGELTGKTPEAPPGKAGRSLTDELDEAMAIFDEVTGGTSG